MTDPTAIRVVAAALCDAQRQVLIAQRPAGKHMAGRWEFPGGKVGTTETEAQALIRELQEELGVLADKPEFCLRLTHHYPDRTVDLSFWIVREYSGTPQALDGQQLKWIPAPQLTEQDILEADRPFIDALQRLLQ